MMDEIGFVDWLFDNGPRAEEALAEYARLKESSTNPVGLAASTLTSYLLGEDYGVARDFAAREIASGLPEDDIVEIVTHLALMAGADDTLEDLRSFISVEANSSELSELAFRFDAVYRANCLNLYLEVRANPDSSDALERLSEIFMASKHADVLNPCLLRSVQLMAHRPEFFDHYFALLARMYQAHKARSSSAIRGDLVKLVQQIPS